MFLFILSSLALSIKSQSTTANATLAPAPNCTAKGTPVIASGIVMDNLCIKRGTLLDNPQVRTLNQPILHSIHCLIDVPSCVSSEFTLLSANRGSNGQFSVAWQLGKDGTRIAEAQAAELRKQGAVGGYIATVAGINDGTPQLKCLQFSENAMADGKLFVARVNAIVNPGPGTADGGNGSASNGSVKSTFIGRMGGSLVALYLLTVIF